MTDQHTATNGTAVTAERVAIDVSDHVATVTLTRPEKHNALDVAMFDAITAAAARVAVDRGDPIEHRDVERVVLLGPGGSGRTT